jgi:addiction module HigA family antidote
MSRPAATTKKTTKKTAPGAWKTAPLDKRDRWMNEWIGRTETPGTGRNWAQLALRRKLKYALFEQHRIDISEAASALGVSRQALDNMLQEKAGLSPAMAVRIEQAFGQDARELLALQLEDQLFEAAPHAARLVPGGALPAPCPHRGNLDRCHPPSTPPSWT